MDVFTALAEPTRRHILELLAANGQLSATDISNQFKVSPPAISQHLKILREARLIEMEKRAQQRLYQINLEVMRQFESWLKQFTDLQEERFQALDKLLEREKNKLSMKG